MAKHKNPEWVKLYLIAEDTWMETDNEKLGAAFKAALKYFHNPDSIPAIQDTETCMAFAGFKMGIGQSLKELKEAKENGAKGAQVRKEKADQATKTPVWLAKYGDNETSPKKPFF